MKDSILELPLGLTRKISINNREIPLSTYDRIFINESEGTMEFRAISGLSSRKFHDGEDTVLVDLLVVQNGLRSSKDPTVTGSGEFETNRLITKTETEVLIDISEMNDKGVEYRISNG